MSTLISSAVGGKKTAPKVAPRRRPKHSQPPPPPAPQPPPKEPSSAPPTDFGPEPAPTSPPSIQQPEVELQAPAVETSEPRAASPVVEQRLPTPEPTQQPPQPEQAVPAVEAAPTAQTEEVQPDTPDSKTNKKKRNATSTDGPLQPAKRTKRSSARSSAQVQTQANEDDASVVPSTEPVIDPQLQEPTPQTEPAGATKAATKRKAPAKRKGKAKSAATVVEGSGDESRAEESNTDAATQRKKAPKGKGRKRKSKKDALATPEGEGQDAGAMQDGADEGEQDEDEGSDPELHEIDPNTVTMHDLGRSKKYGKTSEREKKMAEINWYDVVAKRREAEEKAIEEAELEKRRRADAMPGEAPARKTTEKRKAPAEQTGDDAEQQPEENQEDEEPVQQEAEGGLRFKIVNGQIVEDETTLTIPDQSQVQAQADAAMTEAVEENDLTVKINTHSFLNSRKRDPVERARPLSHNKSDPWSEEETERFYNALKMFGTDFLIISKMFPGKTRPQIKKKFIREERLDLVRVNNALLGRDTEPTPMNIDYYAKETGRKVGDFTKWSTHEDAMARIKGDLREKEDEVRQKIAEREEDKRQQVIAEEQRKAEGKKARKKKGEGKGKKKGGGGGLGGGGPAEEEGGGGEAMEVD